MGAMTHEAQCQIENAETKETAPRDDVLLLITDVLITDVNAFQSLTLRSAK